LTPASSSWAHCFLLSILFNVAQVAITHKMN
jgi:hypothetical protein